MAHLRPGAACAVTLVVLLACTGDDDRQVRPPEIGQPAPAYRTISLTGDSVSLDQVRGRGQTRGPGTHHDDWQRTHDAPLVSTDFKSTRRTVSTGID